MLKFLATLWVLPAALPIWLFYLWPAQALGVLHRLGVDTVHGGVVIFAAHYRWAWLERLWTGWYGHALPGAIVIDFHENPEPIATLNHELRHVQQWYVLGLLFPLVYGVLLLIQGYDENLLERDARAREGAVEVLW